jgi:sorbitol-specific phosphotransferase system component IIA
MCALQSILQWDGGISRGVMINCLTNAYIIRAVGDRAENIEAAIKHGTEAFRGMEELPFLKTTTMYSTY